VFRYTDNKNGRNCKSSYISIREKERKYFKEWLERFIVLRSQAAEGTRSNEL